MQNHRRDFTLIVLVTVLWLTGCGPSKPVVTTTPVPVVFTDTSMPTATPDPCSRENTTIEIRAVHRLMREFDDAAALSASTARDQLKPTIADLQRIRRDAEDINVPGCLQTFKNLQLAYMNTFIQTLLTFMGGADQGTVNQNIGISRQLHEQYMIEMARLQGETIPTPSTPNPTSPVPSIGTLTGTPGTEVPTPTVAIVTNMGSGAKNMRLVPSLDGQTLGMLAVGQSALALGQTGNGDWIMIEVPGQPGQTAWVYASVVQLRGPGPLPVINPTP
jgi:hypothetical protein